MSKEIYISSTPHETRLAIVEDEALSEIYYERENEYTLAGSIYNGRVTRVLPGMQSSFVEIGLERDAFLYITDFMEETPDAEEFDTSPTGEGAPRLSGGKPSGGRQAGSRQAGEAGGRGESAGRNGERGGRGGRGRRGGRDGERNSNQNSDRQDGSDEASRRPDTERGQGEFVSSGGDTDRYTDRDAAQRNDTDGVGSGSTADGEFPEGHETGKDATGGEATHRWRGRRGRRRGRGASSQTSGQTGESAQENSAPTYGEDQGHIELPDDRGDESFERGAGVDIDAEASQSAGGQSADRGDEQSGFQRRDSGQRPEQHSEQYSERRSGQRSDRHSDRHSGQRTDRSARESSPSRYSHGEGRGEIGGTGPIADAYPDEDFVAGAEPIVLPGESLSKYRKGGSEEAAASPAEPTLTPLAPPASLYTLAAGWDGGETLPGETLSRRHSSGGRDESRGGSGRGGSGRGESGRGGSGRGESGRGPDRGREHGPNRGSEHGSERGSGQRGSEFHEPELSEAAAVGVVSGQGFRASTSEPVAPPVAPPAALPAAVIEAEYEPSDASVSYRVDPVSPSEFRQSAPVLEPKREPESEIVADRDTHVAELEEAVPEDHDITSLSPAGEMHSDAVEAPPVEAVHSDPMDSAASTSPMRIEGAVVSPEHGFDPSPVQPGLAAAAAESAAGHGQFAEEDIDEEDSKDLTLHASSVEEIDDLDEEAVEGASELGTMLREMSIDQITRTSPEVEEQEETDDEEDFEEDDLDEEDLEEENEEEEGADENGSDEGSRNEGSRTERKQAGSDRPQPTGASGYNSDSESYSDSDSEDTFSEQGAGDGDTADAALPEEQFGQTNRADRVDGQRTAGSSNPERGHNSERRGGRRDGRRGRGDRNGRGDRSERNDRSDRSERPRSTGGEHERGGHFGRGNGHGRHSMQTTDLPAISDLLKPGQEILVQIAKEPIAKKGARITSHIALPGRFLVFMPTVNHIGVSRKIDSDGERRRLKEILLSEKGEASGGFIVRTAADGASEEELRSDLRFLLNLWADIKARSESSKSPALIYHDLNLIERILRDQVTDNFSAIWVDSETEYERVLRFLQRFQPSLIRRVKLYLKDTPLFEQFGITEEINKALRSKVWLKSGGSIVINQTEALVAIDVNTGKYVGKTARLEDTIVKTNLDAIPEIVRQIRLRDLGGIIIIDFIDMDERKNRNRVMAALEDELKLDRAPSKVLQFNDFGLVAITRKRVKQSLERTLSTPCTVCDATGMVKSPVTVCNEIYIELRKMHKTLDRGDIMLRVHPEVVKQLKASGAKWLLDMEELAGKTILVKSDPALHPEQFDIH